MWFLLTDIDHAHGSGKSKTHTPILKHELFMFFIVCLFPCINKTVFWYKLLTIFANKMLKFAFMVEIIFKHWL